MRKINYQTSLKNFVFLCNFKIHSMLNFSNIIKHILWRITVKIKIYVALTDELIVKYNYLTHTLYLNLTIVHWA